MMIKSYHLTSKEWSYPDIYSIDYFLEDIKDELTESNISENLKILKAQRDSMKIEFDEVKLKFGDYTLGIQGIDEAVSTIRGLEFAFEELLHK